MMRSSVLALIAAMGMAAPAQADPTIGFGLSIALGGGSSDVGIGVRLFSDDEEESAVASVGVDYMFQSNRLRPTVGLAYLDKDFYLGLDLGYDLNSGGVDFGVSAGAVDTESDSSSNGGDGGDGGDGDTDIVTMDPGDS